MQSLPTYNVSKFRGPETQRLKVGGCSHHGE